MLALTPTARPSTNATLMNTALSGNAFGICPWISGPFSFRIIIPASSIGQPFRRIRRGSIPTSGLCRTNTNTTATTISDYYRKIIVGLLRAQGFHDFDAGCASGRQGRGDHCPKRSTRNEVLFLKLRMPENVLSGRAKLTEEC